MQYNWCKRDELPLTPPATQLINRNKQALKTTCANICDV